MATPLHSDIVSRQITTLNYKEYLHRTTIDPTHNHLLVNVDLVRNRNYQVFILRDNNGTLEEFQQSRHWGDDIASFVVVPSGIYWVGICGLRTPLGWQWMGFKQKNITPPGVRNEETVEYRKPKNGNTQATATIKDENKDNPGSNESATESEESN